MNDIFNIGAKIEKPKDLKNRPLLAKMLSEAKEGISAKEKFQVESMQNIRSMIDAENFAGKDKIEVTTSKEERDQLIIKTKDTSFFVDFIYEQEGEVFDSLRKGVIHPPANITLSSKVEGEYHTIMDGTAESCGLMGAELLKHIERKKYPERFGFEKIQYRLENNEIFIVGTKGNKAIRIPFLEGWDDTIRMSAYEFLVHYFGHPVPKIQLQKQDLKIRNYLEA